MKKPLSNIEIHFTIIVIMFVLIFLLSARPVYAGTLSCMVATSCASGTVIFKMQNTSNSHVGTPSSSYTHMVCCSILGTTVGTSCSGTFATALKLSGSTNAHARQGTGSNYPSAINACISVPSGGSISVGYSAIGQSCAAAGYDTTLGTMISTTNSHVGNSAWAPTNNIKICATGTSATGVPISGTLTSSVFDTTSLSTSIGYNSIMWKGTQGTGVPGTVQFQLATATTTTGPWNFYGGTTCGSGDWFDVPSPESPVELKGTSCLPAWNNLRYFRYKIRICSNNCTDSTGSTASPRVDDVIVNWSS